MSGSQHNTDSYTNSELAKKNPKKIFLSTESRLAKRERDRGRAKTRVNIGRAFDSWRDLCLVLGIKTDPELAFFLLDRFSSVVIMLFEVSYFIDALLAMCFPCPPTWKFFIVWKKMAKVGGFQKFLYYTMMSVMCFLHPVLVWHAVIPGIMLLVTGFFNFILSKKKKSDPPKERSASYGDPAMSSVGVTDMGDTEQTLSFFHITTGKRASFFPSNSQLYGPTDSAQSMLGQDQSAKSAQRKKRQTDTRNVHFIESFRQDDNEMEEYHEMEPEEITSDKAPMIRL